MSEIDALTDQELAALRARLAAAEGRVAELQAALAQAEEALDLVQCYHGRSDYEERAGAKVGPALERVRAALEADGTRAAAVIEAAVEWEAASREVDDTTGGRLAIHHNAARRWAQAAERLAAAVRAYHAR